MIAPPAWMRDALCIEYPDIDFFVEYRQSTQPAKAICRQCLVRDECLDYAVTHRIKHGIWGGRSASAALRRRDRSLDTERPESWPARRRDIAARIIEWRHAGMSYDRIASRLQAGGYRTKSGGPWNACTVRDIYLSEDTRTRTAASIEAVA